MFLSSCVFKSRLIKSPVAHFNCNVCLKFLPFLLSIHRKYRSKTTDWHCRKLTVHLQFNYTFNLNRNCNSNRQRKEINLHCSPLVSVASTKFTNLFLAANQSNIDFTAKRYINGKEFLSMLSRMVPKVKKHSIETAIECLENSDHI